MSFVAHVTSDVEDFDQDEIDAFVLTYRLFTQKNDSISLARIAAIYSADWMPSEAKECFDSARQSVNDYLGSAATIMFGEHHVRVGDIIDVIIYGGMAHTNTKKTEIFEEWMRSGIKGFIWAEFFAHAKHLLEILKGKDPNAAAVGKMGGKARARILTSEQRAEANILMPYNFFEQPILNSPYAPPTRHHALDASEQPLNLPPVEGRRRSELITPVPKARKKQRRPEQASFVLPDANDLSTAEQEYNPTPIINEIRSYVASWRTIPNPADWGVTPATQRLLTHWRHHQFQPTFPR